jgi:acetylornithine/N-succinyldiaminopimelate aminotransferase
MLKYDVIKSLDDEFVMPTYMRMPALFVQGAGCSLWDNRGNEYLDLLAGIAVCQLGHCHPAVVAAITRQAQQLMHVSNLLLTAPQAQLAKRLCDISGMDKVFYGTDGATANETALKIAKKHGLQKRPDGDYEIITLLRSFHGRTLGSISATGQRRYQRPFEPLIPGFVHIAPNDLQALREAFSHKTAAIHLEPVMGEGGVTDLTPEFLHEAQRLCREHDALFMLDEVQSGVGRTGKWFAFQHHGVKPDVLCLAKGLGSGMPIGACLASGRAADILEWGDHGATFGGNPMACAAALAVLDTIEHQGLLQHVQAMSRLFVDGLKQLGDVVVEVRGIGLMLGVQLDRPIAKDIVKQAFEKKLILNATDEFTLRLVPPLIINEAQVGKALGILAELLGVAAPTIRSVPVRLASQPLHDLLQISDLLPEQAEEILQMAMQDKHRRKHAPSVIQPLENRTVALVFEKPSLRTRVSFETAIRELGGHPIHLGKADIGMGSREALKDVSTNLSRWCSMIVARLYWQRDLIEMARHAEVPVVNALTELEHPCQALADILTVRENFGEDKVKITYVGDGNNVARSLARLCVMLGYPFTICGPENFRLAEVDGIHQTSDLEEGMAGASVVYTDVWISMGDEHEQEHRLKVFEPYQVNGRVMEMANDDAIFLHCLPARRGFEVTADVIDSDQSRVVDQAENRMHAQKALLRKILS